MKSAKIFILLVSLSTFLACQSATNTKTEGNNIGKAKESVENADLSIVDRPDSIKELMKSPGLQYDAEPELTKT
jgi:hypothetical protein